MKPVILSLLFISFITASAFAVAGDDRGIPPTAAIQMINVTGGGNVTAVYHNDYITFLGSGITITPDYDLQTITFTSTGINGTLPIENYCSGGDFLNTYNATTGVFTCSTPAGGGGIYENNTASNLGSFGDGIYFDGGGDTYADSDAGNQLSFFTGGNRALTIDSSQNVSVEATKGLYLDGGSDTYIAETSANTIKFHANNDIRAIMTTTSSQFWDNVYVLSQDASAVQWVLTYSDANPVAGWRSLIYGSGGATSDVRGVSGDIAWRQQGQMYMNGGLKNVGYLESRTSEAWTSTAYGSYMRIVTNSAGHTSNNPSQVETIRFNALNTAIPSTGKLLFSSIGGNEYISSLATDELDIVVGGYKGIRLDEGGTEVSVIIGADNALGTSAIQGFLYLPTMAGAPSGNSNDYTGKKPMVYDTTNDELCINTSGSTWKCVALT